MSSDVEAQNSVQHTFRRHITIDRAVDSQFTPAGDVIHTTARYPAEFRTLSIHVETKNSFGEGNTGLTRTKTVKGHFIC